MSLRILVAPAGFKESLGPGEVADCIEEGIKRAAPDAIVRKLPLVDGGEGLNAWWEIDRRVSGPYGWVA